MRNIKTIHHYRLRVEVNTHQKPSAQIKYIQLLVIQRELYEIITITYKIQDRNCHSGINE